MRQVEISGRSETLEPRILQVLVALSRRRGEVVSREQLIETCWNGVVVGEDSLNRCIYRLRKLGESSGAFEVETIAKVGYRLHVAASPDTVASPANPGRTPDPETAGKLPAWLTRPVVLALAAFAVLALTAVIYLGVRNSRAVEVARPQMALAVLAFDSPSNDPEMERFARSVSLAIADNLTRGGQVLVKPSLSLALTGAEKAGAAQRLDAQLLVDGYVSRERDGVRIGVRLDHAKGDFTVWSSTLDGALDEPGVVGARLAGQIQTKLRLSGVVNLLNSGELRDAERARALLLVLQRSDDGDDLGAMEGTKRLQEIWPDATQPNFMRTIETMDALPILSRADRIIEFKAAKDAARLAHEFDDRESTGAFTATALATPAYAWGERIKGLEEAIATGRSVPPTANLAINYLRTGRSLAALEKTGDRPMTGKTSLVQRAEIFMALNDKTRADRDLLDGRHLWPLHPIFPQKYLEAAAWMGSPEEAETRLADHGAWAVPDGHRMLLSKFLAARREARRADDVEEQCASQAIRQDETASLYCLSALAALGRTDAAFGVLDILFPEIRPQPGEDPDTRWLEAPAVAWDPVVLYMPWTATLREDERIVPVFERLGLLDYWRTSANWPDFCTSETQSVCAQMKGK